MVEEIHDQKGDFTCNPRAIEHAKQAGSGQLFGSISSRSSISKNLLFRLGDIILFLQTFGTHFSVYVTLMAKFFSEM